MNAFVCIKSYTLDAEEKKIELFRCEWNTEQQFWNEIVVEFSVINLHLDVITVFFSENQITQRRLRFDHILW